MLKRQLHVGSMHFNPEKVKPIQNRKSFSKPRGGFWTSTYNPDIGSAWIQWCCSEEFEVPKNHMWSGVLLTPDPKVRIYTIDCYEDFQKLLDQYGYISNILKEFSKELYLDFESMVQDYDALHLTEKGQQETHLSYPHNLYGWDCESTLWLNPKFIYQEPITWTDVSLI